VFHHPAPIVIAVPHLPIYLPELNSPRVFESGRAPRAAGPTHARQFRHTRLYSFRGRWQAGGRPTIKIPSGAERFPFPAGKLARLPLRDG
jgi:hypothetical protein